MSRPFGLLLAGLLGLAACVGAPGDTVPLQAPDGVDGGAPDGGGHDAGLPPIDVDPEPQGPPPGDKEAQRFRFPALQKEVPHYELRVPKEALDAFDADPMTSEERPATFIVDGKAYEVLVRPRGGSSRYFPKRSWRVEFPEGTKFDGRRKLNFVGMMQDRTMMVEKLGFDLLRAMGAPAPRTRFVRLTVNGKYQGVFVDIERVDKDFTRVQDFVDRDPTIYRCGAKDCEMKLWRTSYQQGWQKKTNESERSTADIEALMAVINHTPEPDLERVLSRHLELEHYLKSMVLDALISNNIVEDSQSYLVHDKVTGRWTYVPWDLNNADARWWPTYGLGMKPPVDHPLFTYSLTDTRTERMYRQRSAMPGMPQYLPAFSNLNTRIAFNPALRERLSRLTERALDELFAPDVVFPWLEAMHALIAPYMRDDPYLLLDTEGRRDAGGLAKFDEGLPYLKEFVTRRTAFVRAQLEALRERKLGLALHALSPAEGWVEVKNHSDASVSTRGMVLTSNVRCAIAQVASYPLCAGRMGWLPARALAPGEVVRFRASELGMTQTPVGQREEKGKPGLPVRGELGLFDGTSVVGAQDVLFYQALGAGKRYERSARNPERWEVR
jgi:spore coat protein H